jgi:ADP-dependent NAD(P)H-hydrate dehydratase / NAD(P)H-hydrate epimerase
MRRADEIMQIEYGYLSILLMENAGRRTAKRILHYYPQQQHFIIIAGSGNNGGDGLVIARHLYRHKKTLFILITRPPEKLSALSRIQYDMLQRLGIPVHVLSPDSLRLLSAFVERSPEKPLVIDALVGLGLEKALREREAALIELLKELRLPAVAVDLPSGLSGDTGQVLSEPLSCSYTFTFQVPKICHVITPAARYCGKVEVLDIGIYPEVLDRIGATSFLIEGRQVQKLLPERPAEAHKGSFGHVLVVGGSEGKAGAPALATLAALRSGAGLATALIPGSCAPAFHRKVLSGMSLPYGDAHVKYLNEISALWATPHIEGKKALVIGPGLGANADTYGFLKAFLPQTQNLPTVLDADALNLLASYKDLAEILPQTIILTPHPGEAARLLGTTTERIQAYRLESALHLAQKYQAIVILKGAYPIVASPKGENYFLPVAEPALATAGTGDVLAGMIGGFLAQGLSPLPAAIVSLYLHYRTARLARKKIAPPAFTAATLLRYMGIAYKKLAGE